VPSLDDRQVVGPLERCVEELRPGPDIVTTDAGRQAALEAELKKAGTAVVAIDDPRANNFNLAKTFSEAKSIVRVANSGLVIFWMF